MSEQTNRPRRLVVGISGATGIAYGVRALQLARAAGVETHLVVSKAADQTRAYETDLSRSELRALADVDHPIGNIGAAIASGSFPVDAMLIAPCSIRTLAAVAYCNSDNLLTRAADVTLKERRPLVLVVRETPLSLPHLRAMTAVTEAGGIVLPPAPAFYNRPKTIEDIVEQTAARGLQLCGIEVEGAPQWQGIQEERNAQ